MAPDANNLGYDDTPIIPGTPWHVHDGARPQPPIVTPGDPPSDAIILFDGTDLSGWESTKDGGPARWLVENGAMQVVPGTGNIQTKRRFGNCQLHLEWCAPAEVKGESQGRGNSGVFMMGTYEIQVLDCYNNPTYADGTTGAIYGQFPPLVNACRPPGEWQTYDIIWETPVFESEQLVKPAYATVLLNGIVIHHHVALLGYTSHRVLTEYRPHPSEGPLMLQDHGDLVRFRNIWYRPLTGYDEG
ncbi:MAG: 3-keto-disaccharide hydrolase [Candidatus Zipacnadales bacterium]